MDRNMVRRTKSSDDSSKKARTEADVHVAQGEDAQTVPAHLCHTLPKLK